MGAEKNVENAIKKSLQKHHYWYTKIFANSYTKKGIPDILAVINGQLVALEIKRPTGGKPTPIQIQNLSEIANNKGLAIITNDRHIVEKIPQLQQGTTFNDTFFLPVPKNLVTSANARELWQHPNHQPTPKTGYSVIITKEEL